MIVENLKEVQANIEQACKRVNRNPKEITLIAVSKTKPVTMLEEVYQAQIVDFGENKVQELVEKQEQLPKDIKWHMIGHLQKNKVKYIIDKVELIHSVDTYALAETIQKEAKKKNVIVSILIEVNIAKEESKYGVFPELAIKVVEAIAKLENIRICGLMTVAPFVENAEENRVYFQQLMKLFVDIKEKNIDNVNMQVLSMGMTGDYEIAIEEGATLVRVGTGIFGNRIYKG
jgi:pyridoxal phosphate enzyme, YggS family